VVPVKPVWAWAPEEFGVGRFISNRRGGRSRGANTAVATGTELNV